MNKSALVLALVCATALVGCGPKKAPPAPPAPAPAAPATPPPAPPPARPEVAPQVDDYGRIKAMSTDEIDRLGLLAEIHFDFDRTTSGRPTARSSPRTPRC